MSTTLCPDCSAPLTGSPSCTACGLALTGPLAGRLWVVDQQLEALRAERASLLARLRQQDLLAPATAAAPPPAWSPPPPRPHRETSPQSVQNTLLTLGALLLAIAGLVFAAVTYRHLGVVGRAAILITLTAAAYAASHVLVRRGLTASAEAVAGVGLVLSVVDAWAARRAGLADGTSPEGYAAVASGVLALLTGGLTTVLRTRVTQVATVALAQGPLVLALDATDAGAAASSVLLALLVAANVAATQLPLPRLSRAVSAGFAGLWSITSLAVAGAAFADGDRGGAVAPLLLAAVAVAVMAVLRSTELRTAAGASVAPLLAYAAWGASRTDLTVAQQPLVLVAVGLLALQAIALLPRSLREGPVVGALVVSATAVLVEGQGVVQAVLGPFTWLVDPWSLRATAARDAIVLDTRWDGTVVTLVALAGLAVAALGTGLLLDRVREAALPAAALLGLAALVLPLGLATSYHVALVLQVAVASALLAVGTRLLPVAWAGLGLLGLTTAWSLAEQDATLAVLPVAVLATAALSLRVPGVLTGAALCLAAGELAAVGVAASLHVDQVGALLLVAPAVAVALSWLLRDLHRLGCEGAALVTAGVAVGLTADDPGWLTWSLAIAGLLALAVAVRPDRRPVGYLGALLLAGSSWVRLADADVTAPEPYVLPLAAMVLVLGHLRRRGHPGMGSVEAYGGGLILAFLPSVAKSLDDADPTRALLVLLAGAIVVMLGGHERLRAPLAVGAAVVAVEAVHLLGPYAATLPRWLVLAVAGAVLVGVGATYEQRLQDAQKLRARFESFA